MYINLSHTPTYYAHVVHVIIAIALLFVAFKKGTKGNLYKEVAWATMILLCVALVVDIVFHRLEKLYNFNQQPYIHFAESSDQVV